MVSIIDNKRDELIELCKKYRVSELAVFGSAVTGDFDQVQSDLDFLVEFDVSVSEKRFDNFFNFQAELKSLFNRAIDLVEVGGLRNPYFIEMVNNTKRSVYVAA